MKVCLNMIVKDEEHCILECLESLPNIDYYVISDTGSTDSTKEIIKEYFDFLGIDGEIHDHPWKNFAWNRNQALSLAEKSGDWDYILIMDADDMWEGILPDLAGDVVEVVSTSEVGGFEYTRRNLVKPNKGFLWEGVVHEVLNSKSEHSVEALDKSVGKIIARSIGSRNAKGKEAKWKRDIKMLKEGIKKEPGNARYMFYLAQTYFSLKQYGNAIHWYKKRIKAGGANEEVFVSKRKLGLSKRLNGDSFESCRGASLDAWESRPQRAEPLYDLAVLCREHGMRNQGMLFAMQCFKTPYPREDRLFIHSFIWEWAALDELAQATYNVGKYEEAAAMFRELLDRIPEEHKDRIIMNYNACMEKLGVTEDDGRD